MFKVSVKNKAGKETHAAKFETMAEAEAWADEVSASGGFGKLDRWVKEFDLLLSGEDINQATRSEQRQTPLGTATYFFFPQEFSVETTDISLEVQNQKDLETSLQALNESLKLIAEVRALNKRKLASGTWSQSDFSTFLASPSTQQLISLLLTGSLASASVAVDAVPAGLYTAEEKADFKGKIAKIKEKLGE